MCSLTLTVGAIRPTTTHVDPKQLEAPAEGVLGLVIVPAVKRLAHSSNRVRDFHISRETVVKNYIRTSIHLPVGPRNRLHRRGLGDLNRVAQMGTGLAI